MGKRKPEPEKAPNHERWLVSYADFITLLFAVFVTLYAMGQVDKKKAQDVIKSLRESFGISTPTTAPMGVMNPVFDESGLRAIPMLTRPHDSQKLEASHLSANVSNLLQIKGKLESALISRGEEGKILLTVSRRGLTVTLTGADFFFPGQAKIRPEVYPILDNIGRFLSNYMNPLRIEGYTDNTPVRSPQFPSNWELSSARALSVLHYFIGTLHFPPTQLSATGYGPNYPIADNSTRKGRRLNRRVEIVLLAGDGRWAEP